PEREQHRAHRAAVLAPDPARIRRRAFAVDGKCLRGAVRADGSRIFVLTAVRHDDATTAALREIGAKTNEIPEFAPLLDTIDDADLREAVITVDAMHAQKGHARYLVEERHAHYLLSVKNNPLRAVEEVALGQGTCPGPFTREGTRPRGGTGGEGLSVDGLLFPHARQVVRIHCKRLPLGAKKWQTETVYAVTDLPAHRASPAEIASWARGHWIIENTVRWTKDVTSPRTPARSDVTTPRPS
ncbi:transposase, partial [Streptomyces mirabilis]|uniref:transposase n=1 Tax=Streptomyces mirabilis TaxID=68239 RepID=UPI0036C1FC2C